MSRLYKAAIWGLMIGVLGLVFGAVPLGFHLEEKVGLDLLFRLRGSRKAPDQVRVVSIDKYSADKLNLPNDPEKWPRSLHARLVENLKQSGASVIAFDLIFDTSRPSDGDKFFARAMRNAGNVVLCENLTRELVPLMNDGGRHDGDLNIEQIIPPIPLLEEASLAAAPFPLPKVPFKVSQYWTFKSAAGDAPTLPIVVFQTFALDVYDDLRRLLENYNPSLVKDLPVDQKEIRTGKQVGSAIKTLRDIFRGEPHAAEKILRDMERSEAYPEHARDKELMKSLIRMYESPESQYLNFYGPPRTIPTIPYYHVVQPEEGASTGRELPDFSGKAVFVGVSENLQPEQKDGFYTVFSQPNGLDINGVEIAATAFANLHEGMPVKPLEVHYYLFIISLWGVTIGVLCRFFSPMLSLAFAAVLSAAYCLAALFLFKTYGSWFPLVIPLFIQVPVAFMGALLWQYIDSSRERENIRQAFKYYLPDEVVDQFSKKLADVREDSQVVYSTVLFTDAEHFTTLSETMDPRTLSGFINRYYESIFEPVKHHGGVVANVVGDSMLALWVTLDAHDTSRKDACLAAIDIAAGESESKKSGNGMDLRTRGSLHSGKILLGTIGAIDHFEYRPVGDIVNTAARIDGLNKYLGTRILVTDEVLQDLDEFLTRELGMFRLLGKYKPIAVHELMCRREDADADAMHLCSLFGEALRAFRERSWERAHEKFSEIKNKFVEDGPSNFYVSLCEQYAKDPPGEPWDGVVQMEKK